jgi:hypothetical protein
MTRCPRCQDATHLEFPDGDERCNGCDRTPSWCRCTPTKAEFVPVWRRPREGRGIAKDLTGTLVA